MFKGVGLGIQSAIREDAFSVKAAMANFFNFSPTSNHLHPLQVENCGSNSWLVVDEDDYGKFRLERVKAATLSQLRMSVCGPTCTDKSPRRGV